MPHPVPMTRRAALTFSYTDARRFPTPLFRIGDCLHSSRSDSLATELCEESVANDVRSPSRHRGIGSNMDSTEVICMNRIVAAAALTMAIWGIKRWLDQRETRIARAPHNPTEAWENEGGAVSNPPAWTQSSQAPH